MRHVMKTSGLTLLALLLTASATASTSDNATAQTNSADIQLADGSWQRCADVPWKVQEVYGATRDGKVIIAGGMALSDTDAPIGIDRTGIYDPATNAWTEGPALPALRHHPLLLSAGGRLYAFGGATHGDTGG